MLRVIPGSPDLLLFLVERISAEDRTELFAASGREQTIRNLEAALRRSARSWCAVDDAGVVFLVAAVPSEGAGPGGAILWGLHTAAVRRRLRESLICFHQILAEARNAFAWVGMDVPAFESLIRRARRAGFAIGLPFDMDGDGLMVCPCVHRRSSGEDFHHG